MTRTVGVTVLVCTRGRPTLACAAVASVLVGDVVPTEIVVVDQSPEPNEALAHDPHAAIRYLHQPGRGLAVARNLGFGAATNEVIAVLDDDMTVDGGWLGALVDGRTGPTCVTTGRVLPAPMEPGQHPLPDAAQITLDRPAVFRGRQARDVVPGASVTLPRDLVVALGGFDERLGAGTVFGSAEDNDIGLRLLDAGVEVRHVPDAIAWHRNRDSPAEDRRIRFAYGLGKGALHAKWLGDRQLAARLGRDVLRRSTLLARRGWRDRTVFVAQTMYLAGLVVGFLRWWTGGWWRQPAGGRSSAD